jgi:hypothetical protein
MCRRSAAKKNIKIFPQNKAAEQRNISRKIKPYKGSSFGEAAYI